MKNLTILIILLLSSLCFSQSTTFNFQVTDTPDSQIWANGTWRIQLQPLTGDISTTRFTIAGTTNPVPNTTQTGSLSTGGSGSATLTPNASINPIGSQWKVTVCPQATASCFTTLFFVFGTTQSVTIAPPSPRINAGPITLAYLDTEVNTGLGQIYFNITSGTLRICTLFTCNGTGYAALTGGGGGGCTTNPADGGCALTGTPSIDQFIGAVGPGTGWLVQLLTTGMTVKVPISVIGSGAAGNINFDYGADPGLSSGIVVYAPTTGTPYRMAYPPNASSGFYVCSNLANNVTCDFQSQINANGDLTGIVPYANGGTNAASQAAATLNIFPAPTRSGDIPLYSGTSWVTCAGNTGGGGSTGFLTENGIGACGWVNVPIPIVDGGTGLQTLTANSIYRGNGTGAILTTTLSDDGTHTTVGGGFAGDGGGFKHKRGTAGCATAASAGATCTTVVTWTTTFADANYTPHCWGRTVTSGVPVNGAITTFNASTVTFTTVAATAAAAQFTNIDCEAVHD